MTTQTRIYNGALRLLGERRLTSTSEARDARYHLDDGYTEARAFCLEQGYWNFAMRAVSQTKSLTLTPAFGFTYAFEKPSDWVRTYIVSADPYFESWVSRFNDENGVWYADITPIYARYVSNDTSYGYDLALWPQTYADYVSARLAVVAGPSIKAISESKMQELETAERKTRIAAKNKDAMNEPPMFPPTGSWAAARLGRYIGPRSETLGY